jgi:hypothetical protein
MTQLSQIQNSLVDLTHKQPVLCKDTLAAQVAAMQSALHEVNAARNELNAVEGAMELILQLLEAAHAKSLIGDHLHCLLSPLQAKLRASLIRLDEVL